MKKNVLLVTIISALLLLVGCGKKEGTGKVDNSEFVTLTWYNVGVNGNSKDHDMVMAELNKYLKEKINAAVDLKVIDYGDYEQKMQVKIAAGEPYDISFTSSWTNNYWNNVGKNAYFELTPELMKEYAPEYMAKIRPSLWEGAKVNGKNYAIIPNSLGITVQSRYVFKKDLVEKYNFDLSKTMDPKYVEFMFDTIMKNEKDIKPFDPNNGINFNSLVENVADPIGVRLDGDKKNIKAVNVYEAPEFLAKAKRYREWYLKGYIPKEIGMQGGQKAWEAGKIFAKLDTYSTGAEPIWSSALGFEVVSGEEQPPIVNSANLLGSLQAISATSENPERALQFLNLVNTDPYVRNLLQYGIEGVHYKKIENNQVEKIEGKGQDWAAEGYTIGSSDIKWQLKGTPLNLAEEEKKLEAKALISPILGFNFDVTPVKTEIATIANIRSEMVKSIVNGTVDSEPKMQEMLDKMKKAGIDKIQAEVQKQLDAWQATVAETEKK